MARRKGATPKRGGGRPAKISRARILHEARQLGAGELTLPRIAQRLGVRPPALYYHFKSRDELLNTLAETLAHEFAIEPGDPKRWRPWLEETALRFYDFLQANPAVFDVANWRLVSVMGWPLIEAVLTTLQGAGHSIEAAGRIWEAIGNMAYAEARLLSEFRRAERQLAAVVSTQKPVPPRTAAWMKTIHPDPRQQFRQTLRWIVTALPEPGRHK